MQPAKNRPAAAILLLAALAAAAGEGRCLAQAAQDRGGAAAAQPAAPGTAGASQAQPAAGGSADDLAALRRQIEALKQDYQRRIEELEKRLVELEGQARTGAVPSGQPGQPALSPAAAQPAGPEAQAAPVPAPPGPEGQAAAGGAPTAGEPQAPSAPLAPPAEATPAGGASQTSNYFNPSVSVIGNFLGVAGHNPVTPLPVAELRESELGLQAIVDPYLRADFFISFGEHGVDVEEGYATFTSLPYDLLAKVGRMRIAFGKINTLHLHVLPWPDEPLPVVNLLGGEEGWIGTGASLARLIPLPGDTFSELTAQVVQGDSNNALFHALHPGDLAYNGHYRIFRDLTEATNLDLGFSYGDGPNGTGRNARTHLIGTDFTLRWKPLVTATYRSFTLRGEAMTSQRDQPGGRQDAVGGFLSGEVQLARRWFTGLRLESSEHADDASLRDTGEALTLTFWPSEFSQLRAEYRHRRYGLRDGASDAHELLLQMQFAIGAHGAHPF